MAGEKQGKLTKIGAHMHVTIFKFDETYPLSSKALEKGSVFSWQRDLNFALFGRDLTRGFWFASAGVLNSA